MPPAAISRSSTYFPKICGNIAPGYRSAFAAGLLSAAAGCSDPGATITRVTVSTHQLAGCPVPDRGPTDPSPFRLTLTPLGPFRAGAFDLETDLGLDDRGHPLAFNPATVGVDAVASDTPDAPGFIGHTERRDGAAIDVLLWPTGVGCPLLPDASIAFPGNGAGQALGYAPELGVALAAGEDAEDKRAGSALAFAVETGSAGLITRDEGALHVPRAFASVTPFANGLLVAGGVTPFPAETAPSDPSGTAELYLPERGGFGAELLELSFRRAHHAALALPSTGETLLIGGVAPDAAGERAGLPIKQFEAISPDTGGSSISDLEQLELGRVDPVALVLTNGRLFVGGGYAPGADASAVRGTPIGLVEWFSPDATEGLFTAELPPRHDRTFAALPGGGVLSVARCREEQPGLRDDCTCIVAQEGGCDANDPAAPWVDAWWIDPEGTPTPVPFARGGALSTCPTPERPLLVPGSDGSPWLISTRGSGEPACLWRFEPWPERPSDGNEDAVDPSLHARFVATGTTLEPAPDTRVTPLSLGPDAFLWIGESGGMYGARLGHRGPLTRDALPLVSPGDPPYGPAHLAPDRDPERVMLPAGASAGSGVRFDGSLELEPTEPKVTLWATDTLYDDVAITLEVDAVTEDTSLALPELVLESPVRGASTVCTWPERAPEAAPTTPLALGALRQRDTVVLSVAGLGSTSCSVPAGPRAVGLRAGAAPVKVRGGTLTLERQ